MITVTLYDIDYAEDIGTFKFHSLPKGKELIQVETFKSRAAYQVLDDTQDFPSGLGEATHHICVDEKGNDTCHTRILVELIEEHEFEEKRPALTVVGG